MSNGQGRMQQRVLNQNQMGYQMNGEQGREYQQNGNQNTENYYQQQSQQYRQPSYNPNMARNSGNPYDQNGQNESNGYDQDSHTPASGHRGDPGNAHYYSQDASNGDKRQQQQPSDI
jgi:hypothetical protein